MRQIIFLLPLLFCVNLIIAQGYTARYFNIPDSVTATTNDIARYINLRVGDDEGKVWSIYHWVISNLSYDKDSSFLINAGIDPDAKITAALRRRRGVCENFAAIFNDICKKTGLRSFVINGYTRQSGRVDRAGHSWCATFINKNWYLFDPTWDTENKMNPQFFMVQPNEFIDSHMPYDPLWQLLNYPISHEQFYRGNIHKDNAPYFNYLDSVNAYIKMDSLQRLQSTAQRIQKQGMYNTRIQENYNYVKMHIEMTNQDKDVELYNSAIIDLNEATNIFNNFIQYRNNQFTPEKADAELKSLLIDVDYKIDSSLKKLNEVDKSQATLTLSTELVREKINVLMKKVQDQKFFLNQYLNTAKPDRKDLFKQKAF